MDININVRMQKFAESATSAEGSVKRKTSPRKKTQSVNTDTGLTSILEGQLRTFAKGALSIVAMGKLATTLNRIEGSITGNRFQERRRSDTIRTITNPGGMLRNVVNTSIEKHYETIREFERADYRRQLSGLVMPFRDTDPGMRL